MRPNKNRKASLSVLLAPDENRYLFQRQYGNKFVTNGWPTVQAAYMSANS